MTTQTKHIDADGRVYCPLAGANVALERCLFCPRQVDFDLDSRRPHIVCRVPDVPNVPTEIGRDEKHT